jgi:hypothetical protein
MPDACRENSFKATFIFDSINMKLLIGPEHTQAEIFMQKATEIAQKATCERSKCGCVIVKEGKIIGKGFNSPAQNLESQRRCHCDKEQYHKKVTDKTCCIHAEQRAILDALKSASDQLPGSDLYFIRLDQKGEITKAGEPYCTICSKMALEVGIKSFHLWHSKGIIAYDTEEYNILSYQYQE